MTCGYDLCNEVSVRCGKGSNKRGDESTGKILMSDNGQFMWCEWWRNPIKDVSVIMTTWQWKGIKLGSYFSRRQSATEVWTSLFALPPFCEENLIVAGGFSTQRFSNAYWKMRTTKDLSVMMTSWYGNAFRITGPVWGESTGYWCFLLTKGQ